MSLDLVGTGSVRKDYTTNQTATIIKATPGKVGQIVVWGVGSGATIDLYDDPATATAHCWNWATADGKATFPLQYPMLNGIVVSSTGNPSFSIVYV